MELLHAVILGLVEGLTEFIPVSSTGHLILAGAWLGLDADPARKAAVDAFDIVIQAGALLACIWYYAPLLIQRVQGLRGDDPVAKQQGQRLLAGLAVAFVPVVVAGLTLRKPIKRLLFGPAPVAVALAVGGVAMIAVDLWLQRSRTPRDATLEELSPRTAIVVGLFQCLSLVPGTSRSMATMVGGLLAGLDRRAAADFAFLLAIPVLGAATAYEAIKEWRVIVDGIGPEAIAVGLIASFLTGWASIALFIRALGRIGLWPFGVYRLVAALVVWRVLL
ncbi:MAG: undecaprenyl-diphosphate phosphatase [Deltaproteobacteria bacterium]|nr:undecaprenyl-diphosphate phosphatase [Deltaproteobacteria bacterium]